MPQVSEDLITYEKEGGMATIVYSGYCVKCRTKRDFEGAHSVGPSGRHMAKGPCPTCGCTISRLLPNPNKVADSGTGLEKMLPKTKGK
jgi:hypothetical protein